MSEYGVSLSVKQCRNFGIESSECLNWLLNDCGFRRFRLMSYWDEIEQEPGKLNFDELDKQIRLITEHEGTITLCLGASQPRWPENHWPDWAWQISKDERTKALLKFIKAVVNRYKNNPAIISYQLENEALLKFGEKIEIDRSRLRQEFKLVKRLDNTRPIIMTTSTSWGIPLRRPIPDIVGFSYYQKFYNAKKGKYTTAFHKPWLVKIRTWLVKLILRRDSFIHELQLEPWGPKNIWDMSIAEQDKSMSIDQIKTNIKLAKKIGLKTIDLWGAEWWYWSYKKLGKPAIAESVINAITKQ